VTEQVKNASTIAVHIVLSILSRYIFLDSLLPRRAVKTDTRMSYSHRNKSRKTRYIHQVNAPGQWQEPVRPGRATLYSTRIATIDPSTDKQQQSH
jgi:hypothetical protein